jgi:hypothetical protein
MPASLSPDTGFTVGSNQADSPKAWAEATEDKQRINTIMCGFDTDVYISGVQIRETNHWGGAIPSNRTASISLYSAFPSPTERRILFDK